MFEEGAEIWYYACIMKISKLYIVCALMAVLGVWGCRTGEAKGGGAENETVEVRVAAWNMKWFPSGFPITDPSQRNPQNEYKRVDSAARFIAWQKADIVLLEEIRDDETCMMLCTNDAIRGWSVGVVSRFEQAPDATVPAHQNAIISRFTAVDSGWRRWKSEQGLTPPRGFVYAVYEINGKLLATIGVHLKSNYIPADAENAEELPAINRKLREISARQLVEFARELEGKRYNGQHVDEIVIAGDFNTSIFDDRFAGEETVTAIRSAGFADCFDGVMERNTMPESKWYPATCFDYIFAKGTAERYSPVVAPKSWTSDHQMISTILSF